MTVMYFKPTAEQVAAAKASNCPMATPRDPSDCVGRKCMHWNLKTDSPCAAIKPKEDGND